MKMSKAMVILVLVIFVSAVIATSADGKPSRNNPRVQEDIWEEQDITYNMTYLVNGNLTANIQPPTWFKFDGNGTVVMWRTVCIAGEENVTYEHLVLKVVNGSIIWEKVNEINKQIAMKVKNKSADKTSSIMDDNPSVKNFRGRYQNMLRHIF